MDSTKRFDGYAKDYTVGVSAAYEPEKIATRAEMTEAIVNVWDLTAKDETEASIVANAIFLNLNVFLNWFACTMLSAVMKSTRP